jgi:hypothetical protein
VAEGERRLQEERSGKRKRKIELGRKEEIRK